MIPSEFKAWFDGFTEALDGIPSEEQWKRIQARVAEIDGRAITEHVYINRYVPHWHPDYYWRSVYVPANGTGSINFTNAGGSYLTMSGSATGGVFDSQAAMLALGRAEAMQMTAGGAP